MRLSLFFTLLFLGFSPTSNARHVELLPLMETKLLQHPDNEKIYAAKNGTVLSVRPATIEFRSTTDHAHVFLRKTGGKAKTKVAVFVNGRLMENFTFVRNERDSKVFSHHIKNAKGRRIKVVISNLSATDTFKYGISCTGQDLYTGPNCRPLTVSAPVWDAPKTFYYQAKCKDQVDVKVTRLRGKAAGRAKIFVGDRLKYTWTFPKGLPEEKSAILLGVKNKTIRVELYNLVADGVKDVRLRVEIEQK